MGQKNAFQLSFSVLKQLSIFRYVILGVNNEGLAIRLNIIAVNCQTSYVQLLDIKPTTGMGGFE